MSHRLGTVDAVEPAVALGVWLLNTAVAPDAYTRIVNIATSRSDAKELAGAVRAETGLRPRGGYRRWLRTEQTWNDLVARRQDAHDRLVESLAAAEATGILRRRAEDRARAEMLVDATIAYFLPTLDPSTAVAVADFRAERRHQELIERLDASGSFEEQLELLPPAARAVLRDESDHRGIAVRVADGVVRGDPRTVLTTWCNTRPDWLSSAPAVILLALAELAQAYGLRREAARLFEETADLGLDAPRWYARAAFEAEAAGESDRCTELLHRAHAAGGGTTVDCIEAAIASDWARVLSLVSRDEAAEDLFVAGVFAFALSQSADQDGAINFLSEIATANPEYTSVALRLAELLLARTTTPGTTSRERDRRQALDLAVGARDVRRIWRGDSAGAVELACKAAMLAGDYARVVSLGTAAPEGEAWPEEAANPEVQFSVAQAALAAGDRDFLSVWSQSLVASDKRSSRPSSPGVPTRRHLIWRTSTRSPGS